MGTYLLIWVIAYSTSQGAALTSGSTPFQNQSHCEKARQEMQKQVTEKKGALEHTIFCVEQ